MTPPGGPASGSGATAEATVGANGAVTALTITNPGSGYAAATVAITGAGTGATADAVVQTSGAVTSVVVDVAGSRLHRPDRRVQRWRRDDAGYRACARWRRCRQPFGRRARATSSRPWTSTCPTTRTGVQAQGHAVCAAPCGLQPDRSGMGFLDVTGVVVDTPGSGYATAPGVVIRDGTLFDPINHGTDPFTEATGDSDPQDPVRRPRHVRCRLHVGSGRHVR